MSPHYCCPFVLFLCQTAIAHSFCGVGLCSRRPRGAVSQTSSAPYLSYLSYPVVVGFWMLLSLFWMESPLRLADHVAHPDHVVQTVVEVLTQQRGTRTQQTMKQKKQNQEHAQGPTTTKMATREESKKRARKKERKNKKTKQTNKAQTKAIRKWGQNM